MNINSLVRKLEFLKAGKTLIMSHSIFGKYSFRMNTQHPSQIEAKAIDEKAKEYEKLHTKYDSYGNCIQASSPILLNPELYIFWGYGDWQVEIEPMTYRTVIVDVPGVYESI